MNQKFSFSFFSVLPGVFVAALLFYFINPVLHYHTQQIAWHADAAFLKSFTNFAGGPGEYITLFISRFFASRMLGVIMFTFFATIFTFLLFKVGNSIATTFINLQLAMITPVLMALLMTDYLFNFSIFVNLCIVLVFLYLKMGLKNEKARLLWILVSGVILYYISGGMFFLVYMILTAITGFSKGSKFQLLNVLLCIFLGIVVPFIFYSYVFQVSIEEAYYKVTPDLAPMLRFNNKSVIVAIILFLPLFLLLPVIGSYFPISNLSLLKGKFSTVLLSILVLSLSVVLCFFTFNQQSKIKAEINYYASNGDWGKVSEFAGLITEYDRMVNFQFNRAISHRGEMLDKLFYYPQVLGVQGLFLDKPFTSEVALPSSDLYFDLGNINESQRFAYEAQTLMHYSPLVLYRLALNSIIMEEYNAAKTFLNVLKSNSAEKLRFEEPYRLVEHPLAAAANPVVKQKRKLMNKPEGIFLTPKEKLEDLLRKNSDNKIALEYLIAFDLMEHDLASFTKHINDFKSNGFNRTPVVIEEAVLLFLSQRPDNEFLKHFSVSNETRQRFTRFAKVMQGAGGDKAKARIAADEFKNTYWYYVLFTSPLVTKVKLETRPSEANY